mgnify:CR=1 FL=1
MNSSILAKFKQWQIALILLVVILIISGIVLYMLSDKPKAKKILDTVSVQMTSGGERLNAEKLWREKMEDEQKIFKKGIEDIQGLLNEQTKKEKSQTESLNDLQNSLLAFQEKVSTFMENPGFKTAETTKDPAKPDAAPAITIKKFVLNLSESKKDNKVTKTILETIPAGAFAQAVMLSGMDASSAMNAASNPIPLLLRLIHPGTLPRHFKSDLKDCHCTASGYGDISSERIHVRLEKLSCIERKTGEIVSTEVAGYIAGPDGREGVRGTIVSKEGSYLSRGALGGVFSGFAKVASPHNRQSMVNPFGLGQSFPNPSTKELFQSGFLEGGGSALDKLSQYYINRAEQLQPIVQVPGGQVVDIVFTEEANIGESELKEAISKKREKARAKVVRNETQSESKHNDNQPFYMGEQHE